MEVAIGLHGSLGQEHFGDAKLGDQRRTLRLVKAADRIFAHPGGSLPKKMVKPADLKGLYRLMDQEAVTHQAVLESHRRRTIEQMSQRASAVECVDRARAGDRCSSGC